MGTKTLRILSVCVHPLSLKLTFIKTLNEQSSVALREKKKSTVGVEVTCIMQLFWLCLEGMFTEEISLVIVFTEGS